MTDSTLEQDVAAGKALIVDLMGALDRRDIDGVLTYTTPDAVWHGFAPQPLDSDGYRTAIQVFLDAFTDSRFPVQAVMAERDRVACLHHLVGTHLGSFQGVQPTGRPVRVGAIVTFRLENGKVAETWLTADILGLLMQIGAVPAPAAS
jgi:predicted ester cyclase